MSKYSKKRKESTQLSRHARQLADLGYDIVPIAAGLKHPNRQEWQRMDIDVDGWEQEDNYTGVGVRTKDTPAVDVDVQNVDICDQVLTFTRALLGDTICRVGLAPKALLFYRADKTFKKVASAKYADPDGAEHRVEVLGDGQQAVAYHIHPDTGEPYYYVGDELTSVSAADLPVISLQQGREIIEYFESLVPDDWKMILPRSGFGQRADLAVVRGGLNHWDELTGDEKDHELGCMLSVLIGDACDERETWKDIVAMCVRSGAPHRREICQAWSRTSDKYDDDGFEVAWQSYSPVAEAGDLTMGTLIYTAGTAGWTAPWGVAGMDTIGDGMEVLEGMEVLPVFSGQPVVVSNDLLDRYVYLRPHDMYYDLRMLTPLTRASLNTVHGSEMFLARTGQRCKAGTWMEQQPDMRVADGYTWLPKGDGLVSHEGRGLVNTWRGFSMTPVVGDVSVWLELVEHLIPDERERSVYMDRLAFDLQYPEVKCSWHIVMVGTHGAGKECVLTPVFRMFGKAATTLGNEDIKGGWDDGFIGRKLIVVSEVRGLSGDAMEKLKRKAASASNDLVILNPKGEKQVEHPNLWSFIFITNYRDAMRWPSTERRWFCVEAREEMSADLISRYFPWLEQPGSCEAVVEYLMTRDLSGFNVATTPYKTDTFYTMCDIAKADHEQLLTQWMEDGTDGFEAAVVKPSALRERLAVHKVRISISAVKQWLQDNDYSPYPAQVQKKVDGVVVSKSRSYHMPASVRALEKHEVYDIIEDIEGEIGFPGA